MFDYKTVIDVICTTRFYQCMDDAHTEGERRECMEQLMHCQSAKAKLNEAVERLGELHGLAYLAASAFTDYLLFLSGQEEVREVVEHLYEVSEKARQLAEQIAENGV